MWWLWVLAGLGAWFVLASVVGVAIGRAISLGERRAYASGGDRSPAAAPAEVPARTPRRAVPLPPVGVALAALAVALETGGYAVRLTGASGAFARALSMDGPFSVPRLFVAGLFAAGAAAALAGATRIPGRRTWWTATAVVAAAVAAVKAGSTFHAQVLHGLGAVGGPVAAGGASVLMAALVVGALAWLSRTERRDRRRVLGSLAAYGAAAAGLSAVSSLIADAYGTASTWAATATFLEEAGEALAGVAFLLAVLAGVAPRLVLPAGWPLRRTVDPYTLDPSAEVARPARAADVG